MTDRELWYILVKPGEEEVPSIILSVVVVLHTGMCGLTMLVIALAGRVPVVITVLHPSDTCTTWATHSF